jgi:hypothetical protein
MKGDKNRISLYGHATQGKLEFWVYENHHNERAIGHVQTCRHFKKQGGEDLATGQWHGPYPSKAQAIQIGNATGRSFRWCKVCDRT